MDTHDVSDHPQYARMLRDQRQKLQDAQSQKGNPLPTLPPPAQTVMQFKFNLMVKSSRQPTFQQSMLKSSHVPLPYLLCTKPLSELKKMMIKDLLLETQHRGAYLLVRAVTPQDRLTAVMAIVEDENGDVLLLQLYHQEDGEGVEEILVEGMVVILKEPYLKLTSNGGYGLRVDHPSDVIFLPMEDERIPVSWKHVSAKESYNTAMAWKTGGNAHFNKSKFRSAIECYTLALTFSPTPEESHTILLNRSLAFLKTNQFDAALSDLEPIITTRTNTVPEKALFRKAEALYNVQRFRECCEVLKDLRLEYPNNTAAKAQMTRALNRLTEQTNGKYPFKLLYTEATKLRPPHLDRATYTGPVAVKPSGSRGRGLFTTKAVKAGELLFCEKAFAHAFVDTERVGGGSKITILMESDNKVTMGAQSDLINMVIRKLHRNPSLIPIITDLHHGSYHTVDTDNQVDGKPVIDTFLIRRIISLNCFGCPLSSLADQKRPNKKSEEHHHHSCGLWPMASYINHSCISTARRSFVGDMMTVRATRDLAPDTEVTMWYRHPVHDNSYPEWQDKFRFQWGFTCDCPLCEDLKNTSAATLGKRTTITAGVDKYLSTLSRGQKKKDTKDVANKMTTVFNALAATYSRPATQVPRLASWLVMQKALMKVIEVMSGDPEQPMQMIKLILGAFAALGYVIEGGMPGSNRASSGGGTVVVKQWGFLDDGVVSFWMYLRDVYGQIGALEYATPAEEYAKTAYRMVFGEDETFGTYGDETS